MTRNIKRVKPVHIYPFLASIFSCAELNPYELLVERGLGLWSRNLRG